MNRVKKQTSNWEKVSGTYKTDTGLVARIFFLQVLQVINKKTDDPIEKLANDLSHLQIRKSKWPIHVRNAA